MRPDDPAPEERIEGRAGLTMSSPLSAVIGREPITVPPDATVRQALERMDRMRVGSIVVVDPGRRVPLGIFTLQDLLRRVSLPGGDLDQPVACVMTAGLITLRPETTAYQAVVVMARHGVRHVVVVDAEERLVGVVSQNDLFSLQRVGVKEISNQIRAADGVEELARAAAEIRRLAETLLSRGVGAETLTNYVSTLNDLLTVRVIERTADALDLPTVRLCWIALGSEGRLEQTFATDQDNGIVFEADDADAERVRQALLPFARAVNDTLAACGFPMCKGEVMAGNPRWCLSLDEWRRTFHRWIDEAQPKALLDACIFFDLRPVYGQEALAERLRESVLSATRASPRFLRLMAELALETQPPLGLLRDFVYDDSKEFPHTIDLKKHGASPIVDAARVFSLANGVSHTSTAERLRAVADGIQFGADGAAALTDAFHFIQLLRIRNQVQGRGGGLGANRVDPAKLNELDRQVLKEAFRQVRKLQNRLAFDYRVS